MPRCLLIVVALLVLPQVAAAQWVVLHDQNGHAAAQLPAEASATLRRLAKQGATLNSIAFTPGGGWVILHDKNGVVARNLPAEAYAKLTELAEQGAQLTSISFTPRGGWVILHDKNGVVARNLPAEAFKKFTELSRSGAALKGIAFTPSGGWVILHDRNGAFARNIPDEAYDKLNELAKQGAQLKAIAFAPGDGWVILHDENGLFAGNIPDEAYQKLVALAKQGAKLTSVSFGRPYIQLSRDDAATRQAVLARLAHYKVPGVSIVLIQDGKLEWARAFGVPRRDQERSLTGATRFQAASISKPVTALAALLLAQQKKVDLDQDLNAKLRSWKVPENKLTQKQSPTLRQVLSHSAGFNVHGFDGYPTGAPRPSLVQLLDGKKPANSPAIRVVLVPGTKQQYSGGGYCVVQQLLMDVTGMPFPTLMQEQVLGPLGMKQSTYVQPLPRDWEAEAAVAHDSAGQPIAGRWHVYPEMAAAGLWTTPSDLARFVLALSRAHQGQPDALLKPELAKEMFTRQRGNYGLGIVLNGKGQSLSFSHGGSNEGYRCHLVGFPATGQGAVLMTNSDNGDDLIEELLDDLRSEYAWPG